MLNKVVVEKSQLDQDETLKNVIDSMSQDITPSYLNRQNEPSSENKIEQYLLFEKNQELVGVAYIEGTLDTKNSTVDLLRQKKEELVEIIEESILHAIETLGMIDVNFLPLIPYDTFQEIAFRNHLEISPMDPEIIVVSKSIQKENWKEETQVKI